MPLSFESCFEANCGQTDSQVKFLSRGSGYTLFLTRRGDAVLALRKPQAKPSGLSHQPSPRTELPYVGARFSPPGGEPEGSLQAESRQTTAGTVVRMKLVGANPTPELQSLDELPGKSNYFIGNDPNRWRTNVSNYARVRYRDVYSGVDLVYYGNQRELEYDFVVAPGADPKAITLDFQGADKLSVDAQGDLVLRAQGGELRLRQPVVYQEVNGQKRAIPGHYFFKGKPQRVGFQVGAYDVSKPLVIDPSLSYSTYLGSSGSDEGFGIALDASGNAYVTGITVSTNFPTANPFQAAHGGGLDDAFVTKLSAAGNALVYSTYLGGSSGDDGRGIAVDSSGNAYVTGRTGSTNFPTANPFQAANAGGGDAFVSKLSAAGALLYSTYLGGSSFDLGLGIAVDASGNAYVTGFTTSTNFPTANPFQAAKAAGTDAFVTKLSAAGNTLVYSTYLGGNGDDQGNGIAPDASGNAYVTGFTSSTNFPTANPFQAANAGGFGDAFVSKLNAAGNALVYSTYLGGSGGDLGFGDLGFGIAVDSSGNAYVTGFTESTNFPTANPFQAANAGGLEAFVTKLSAAGNALVYSTYLGGSGFDQGRGIAVDASGNAYVTGFTSSTNFPTANPFQAAHAGSGDAFVTKLSAAGNALVYSTYLGGSSSDAGSGIAVDASGNAYVTGLTLSTNFPTANPFQAAQAGFFDAFVTKISPTTSDLIDLVTSFNLPQGMVNSLDAKLQAALDAAKAGNVRIACNLLNAFLREVQAQSGRALTVDQANQLIALTNQIKGSLGCP